MEGLQKNLAQAESDLQLKEIEINKLNEKITVNEQEQETKLKVWNKERETFIFQIEQLKAELSIMKETNQKKDTKKALEKPPSVKNQAENESITQKEIEILKIQLQNMKSMNSTLEKKLAASDESLKTAQEKLKKTELDLIEAKTRIVEIDYKIDSIQKLRTQE